mgnify:FL=1
MLWLVLTLSQQMRQKIRHKNSGELQKECVLRHFINIQATLRKSKIYNTSDFFR